MTAPDDAHGWKERAADWVWARWGWLLAGIVLLFALNNLAGFVAGAVGFAALFHRVAGRLLTAGRVVRQVRETMGDSGDSGSA